MVKQDYRALPAYFISIRERRTSSLRKKGLDLGPHLVFRAVRKHHRHLRLDSSAVTGIAWLNHGEDPFCI
ncbi:unnamed protein product [Callosobruchus maculatus]|uniref:Uncharacterized protein n=1 Tax=Callosobruchus maculatus TaxID=64391 RepID=A0A653CJ57_CALMS|nr:unnamed protein product [Callosobruchus maculatus]